MPGEFSFAVMRRYPRISGPAALPLFCLAPHGVFHALRITPRAVSSYLAFSPLPVLFSKNRRCVFCDTFRRHNLSIAAPAYFTRHAAVWCSDFHPANPATAGLTSDHLPSANNSSQSAQKKRGTPTKQIISDRMNRMKPNFNSEDSVYSVQNSKRRWHG